MNNINEIRNKFGLDGTTIKIIAVVLMFCDHIHQMFLSFGAPTFLTWLGRPVFALFLFVLAESFHFTRNRKKLLIRLLLASWVMVVGNFILGTLLFPNENIVLMNNAFSTFFIVGLYIIFWDMLLNGIKTKNIWKIIGAILLSFVPIITAIPMMFITGLDNHTPMWVIRLMFFIPNILLVEGGFVIVILGILFYIFRHKRWLQISILVILSIIIFIVNPNSRWLVAQWMMVFAIIPMFLYNGKKGYGIKNFFYIFYPVHIYILYIIATLIK